MLATATVSAPATRTTLRAWGALLALSAAAFLFVTTETLPIGLLQPIGADLGASDSTVGLLVTYYGLVVVFTSLPLTQLTRAMPRRTLLTRRARRVRGVHDRIRRR
jgi:predicted MFS family arabinose efflux permease